MTRPTASQPTFLVIGAIKSGTTWLHRNLEAHPHVWVPPIKELRYFDQPAWDPVGRWLGHAIGDDPKVYEYWRHRVRDTVRDLPGVIRRGELGWHARYFLAPRSPGWYRRLFDAAGDRAGGDVTPLYAPLDADRVRQIRRHFPDLRIVYLLRDPVERTWSHVVMRCHGLPEVDWDPRRITPELVRRTFLDRDLDDAWLWANGRYAETLDRWAGAFGDDRVLVGFHEEVRTDPQGLLDRISAFLDVPAAPVATTTPANAETADVAMPADIGRMIAERFTDDLDRLADRVGGPAVAWRDRAHALAAGVTS